MMDKDKNQNMQKSVRLPLRVLRRLRNNSPTPQPSGAGERIPALDGEVDKMDVAEEGEFSVKVNGAGVAEWEEKSGRGPASQILALSPPVKKRKLGGDDDGAINSHLVWKCPRSQAASNVKGIISDSIGASAVLEPRVPLKVVLTNIFEVCPPADLALFRLVCKEWRDISLQAWRNSATLKLKGSTANGGLYIGGGTLLNQFVEYVEDLGNQCGPQPFRRMKMTDGWFFDPSESQTERFWHHNGRHVTSLGLHDCRLSATELWRITYSLCPNLIRLGLSNCSLVGCSSFLDPPSELEYKEPSHGKHEHLRSLVISNSELPVSWLEVLSHLQSLTSLEVKDDSFSDITCERLLNAVKVIRDHGDGNKLPLPIVHFDIRPFRLTRKKASREKFFLVQQLNLPLKSLIIRAHRRLNLEFVGGILELHSGTLEYLELEESEGFWQRGRMKGKFPCPVELEKLQELKINDVLLESTEVLLAAPNLRSLSISEEDGLYSRMKSIFDTLEDWQAENPGVVLLAKLANLTYLGTFGCCDYLLTLTKLMPNVEELQISLELDKDFSIVCENWKRLKGLVVEVFELDVEYHLTDLGLTGGSLQIEKPDWRWVHKAVHPNITDLKALRSFCCLSNRLTEVSVYNGFLQLPNLRALTLSSRYETSADDDDVEEDHMKASSRQYCFGEEARNDLREKGILLNFV